MSDDEVGRHHELLSYKTTVEDRADGQFDVIVTTVYSDGALRQNVGIHASRVKAELAASLIDRSAKRYEGVGNPSKDAPTYADPELS